MSKAAIALALMAAPATAEPSVARKPVSLAEMTPGYSYFNRPGADLAAHNEAVLACLAEASLTRSMDEVINNDGGGGIVGGVIGGAFQSVYHRGAVGAALENCMVVRGWRVVSLPEAEGKALAASTQAEVAAQLEPWVGAERPHGDVVRVWGNDAADAANARYVTRPAHTKDGQLSLKAANGQTLGDVKGVGRPPIPVVKLDKKWPSKPLQPAQIASVTPEAAILVVRMRGMSLRNGIGVGFRREGPDKATYPSTVDFGPDALNVYVGLLAAKKGGNWMTVAVPPGRWRMANLNISPVLNLCLGSPAFEAKAGEVLYIGTFDIGAEDMGPDLTLEPAKAYLGAVPAAEVIKPAVYTNGSTGICGDSFIYALEIEGAPFEPGYAWGGARPATATEPTAAPADVSVP